MMRLPCFAPKGMVVVWLNFRNTRIELDRYQAKVITDQTEIAKAKEKYLQMYRISPERYEEARKELSLPDASPLEWDNYRIRYNWRPVVSSENSKFRLFEVLNYTYNGEKEGALRPWVLDMPYRMRAIPREMVFFWETGKNQAFEGAVFFDWSKTNEAFKKVSTDSKLELKIAEDNNSFEVLLNGEKLSVDSMRVYKSTFKFKDLYK